MSLLRIIARLDIKGPNVVKGIHMEGLRVVGKPVDLAKKYAQEADEILYIDTVASLYGRNQLTALLEETTNDVFVPITVGGGIGSVGHAETVFKSGADKVAINTAAIRSPSVISGISNRIGAQGVVVSIQAKRTSQGWEAYTDCGRERTGRDAVAWAEEAVDRGAGEILLTSIDQEGTQKGFDLDLIYACSDIPVPLVACGGMGTIEHAKQALDAGADAIALASALHYNKLTIGEIREHLERHLQTRSLEGRGNNRPAEGVREESFGVNRRLNGLC